jgi:hypothetical protein
MHCILCPCMHSTRLPADHGIDPSLSLCQHHSKPHQPPIIRCIVSLHCQRCGQNHILVACHVLWQGPTLHACLLPIAALSLRSMHGAARTPISRALLNIIHSDAMHMLSCGSNSTGQALAPVSTIMYVPDFARFQI